MQFVSIILLNIYGILAHIEFITFWNKLFPTLGIYCPSCTSATDFCKHKCKTYCWALPNLFLFHLYVESFEIFEILVNIYALIIPPRLFSSKNSINMDLINILWTG